MLLAQIDTLQISGASAADASPNLSLVLIVLLAVCLPVLAYLLLRSKAVQNPPQIPSRTTAFSPLATPNPVPTGNQPKPRPFSAPVNEPPSIVQEPAPALPSLRKVELPKPVSPIPIISAKPDLAAAPPDKNTASSKSQPAPPATPRPAPKRPATEQDQIPGEIKYIGYEPLPGHTTNRYPLMRMPAAGKPVPVKFPRTGRSAQRGYCEAAFVAHLRRYFPKSGPVRVLDNHHLPTANASRPYEPDMALLHERNGLNLFLNIEIDEPYDGVFRQPTHCQGDDESRDLFFTRRGWVVLRFAEIQVHQQPEACCAVIAQLIARLDSTYQIPAALQAVGNPTVVATWDIVQAQKWAQARYREHYLGIENFGQYAEAGVTASAEQLPVEAEIEKLVEQAAALPKPARPGPLFKANPDARHAALRFDAAAHQYYINGQPATAVSTVVSRFFPEFDTAYWSARKAAENGCTAAELAQQWADKATASSSAGTLLHQQIEDFYNGGTATYNSADFAHFQNFQRDYAHLVPHRTEWQVYNEELMLAGTVDFVARNSDGTVSIYDWKRSHRVVDANGGIKLNAYQPNEGPLNDLPDCSFSHYTLQQNVYKWLLESRYGCRVRDMHLVVLHPEYDRYHVVPVPERPTHINRIITALKKF